VYWLLLLLSVGLLLSFWQIIDGRSLAIGDHSIVNTLWQEHSAVFLAFFITAIASYFSTKLRRMRSKVSVERQAR